ncbi:Hypothetical predicted protein [Pelobates cultripes]|uniref:Uncharacterized protein n=1 Tax=Pelobates cultripes TaxID=61616 RepID=A0AAD1RNA5_PELCU|nr:Hypothetical predicted protein [Pelobates cultripes]
MSEPDLLRLLQEYQVSHGRGALETLMSGVTAVPGTGPEAAVSVDGAGGRRARRSRPPSRLSPSPVRHGERRSRRSRENRGARAAVAASPALEGGRPRRSRPVGVERAQDGAVHALLFLLHRK